MINRIPEGKQLIVFCGNIKQANRLCPNAYHSKSEGFELQRFRDGHINQLAVVGMLDEAINLQADIAICLGVNAKTRKLIQRIGRLLRKDPDNPDKLAIMIFFVALGTKEVKWMKTNLKIFRKTKLQLWTRT